MVYDSRKEYSDSAIAFDGLRISTRESVYVPHEDSFLLAQATRLHAKGRVLDLGCGTGIVGLAASQNPAVSEVVFADVNPDALELAKKNASENGVKKKHSFVQTDLFSTLAGQRFDTICFNPPYLPTAKEEVLNGYENAAYDGGPYGRRVLDAFLQQFAAFLAPNGILLLLNSSVSAEDGQSGNEQTRKWLEKDDFTVEEIGKQAFFFEQLVAFKADITT